MKQNPQRVQNVYLVLTLLSTLAASFIWGVNTLFLLDAGLSITAAFAANALFSAGQVIFEIPTGVVADTMGRRTSYLLGTLTLGVSTLLYLWAWQAHAPFWAWAVTSVLLGLGFTFFSGATEAWLVDALHATGYTGTLEAVFARGQIVGGIAMLTGSVAGGLVAQATNLGVPYILRSAALLATFGVALVYMRDLGFTPVKGERAVKNIKNILSASLENGLKKPPVRWVMLTAPFSAGVGIYGFYAMQPYLLQLFGNPHAYGIAGLAASIVAGAQILGGLTVPFVRRRFGRRTTLLMTGIVGSAVVLALIGLTHVFWLAVLLLIVWGLIFAAGSPIRQAYLNGLIPSQQRATVLSFDNLMGSAGSVFTQPALGKTADIWGYGLSYVFAAVVQIMALPFLVLARRTHPASDPIVPESASKKTAS
ncbi:MAG TPA: MFS transporter [Candidatus Saccharimonadia bacterium]|nr:MFS transporter [Candidatus Saccharimonadia bacterium]